MRLSPTLSHILKATLFDRDPTLEEQDVIDQVIRWIGADGKRPGVLLTKSSLWFLSKGAGGLNQELLPVGAERKGQSGGLMLEGQRPVIVPDVDYPNVPSDMLPRLVAAQAVELFREHRSGSRLGPDPNMLTSPDMLTEINPNNIEEPEQELEVIEAQRRMRASYGMRLLRYMDDRLKVANKQYIHFDTKQGRSELKSDRGSYNSGQSVGIALKDNPDTVIQVVFKPAKRGGQTATRGQFRNSVIQLCRLIAEKEDLGSLPMTMGQRMVVHFTKGRVPLGAGEVYQAIGDVGGKMVGGRSSARGTRLDYKDLLFMDCVATKESFLGLGEQPFMFAYSLHIQPRAPRTSSSTPNEGGHKINKEVASGLAITPLTKQFSHGYDDHPEVVLYRAGDLLQKALRFYRIAGLMDIPEQSSMETTYSEEAIKAFMEMRSNQPKEGKLGDVSDAVVCHAVSEGRDAILHYTAGRAVLCLNRTNQLTNLRQTNELELLCADLGIDELTVECTVPSIELAQMDYTKESEESLDTKTPLWDEMIVRLKRIPGDSWRQWTTLALITDDSVRPERYSMGGIGELYFDEVVQGEAQAVIAYDEDNRRTIVYAPRMLDAVVIGLDLEGKRPQNGEVGNLLVALIDSERVKIGGRRQKAEIFYPLGVISTFSGFTVENRRGMFEHLVNQITHTEGNMAFVDPMKTNLIVRIEYDGFANERSQTTYRLKHQRTPYEGATYRPQPEGILGTLPGESADYNLDRLVGLGGSGLVDIGPSYLIEHGVRRMPILRNPRVLHLSSYIRSLSHLLDGDPKMVAAFGKKQGKGKDAVFDTGVPLAQINPPPYELYPGGITQMIADQLRMGSLKQKPQGRTQGFPYASLDPNWKEKYPMLAGRLEQAKERGFAVHMNPPTIPFSIEYDGESDDPSDQLSVKDLLDRSLERRGTKGHPLSDYRDYSLYGKKGKSDWKHFESEGNLPTDYTDWQYRPPLLANPLVMAAPTIIAFSGPSGSGKSTVAAHLEERLPGAEIILSYTTRDRRPDEVDGFDKNFVTKESFEEMIESGLFTTPDGVPLYQQQGNGHYYGRRYDELMGTQYPIVDVSFKGIRQLREAFGEAGVFSIFLLNKLSEERRVQIMLQRGEMTEDEARERAMVGTQMLKDYKRYNFDAVVENKFGRLYQTGTTVKKKLFESMDAKNNPARSVRGEELLMPKKLYHLTLKEHLPSIQKNGLVPRHGPLTRAFKANMYKFAKQKDLIAPDMEFEEYIQSFKPRIYLASKKGEALFWKTKMPNHEDFALLEISVPETLDLTLNGMEWTTTETIPEKNIREVKDNPPGIPKQGKELSMERKREIRKRWLELVNMTHTELQRFYDSDLGNKRAGLSRDEAKAEGISSGRDSALAIIKMKQTPVKDWHKTRSKDRARGIMLDFWQWAQKQINFNTRHRAMKGAYLDDKGRPKRKLLGLWIWGHDPWRYALKVDPEPMPPCPDVSWVGSREKKAFGIVEVKK